MLRSMLACLALVAAMPVARAAQSYDNCAGFISSLPATITTQGTWCLRADLATTMTSGAAITVAANNVTLDCNHFKLGDLAAGPASGAIGVYSDNRANITLRHCTIRGFSIGVGLVGTAGGHLVEDNRVDASLWVGLAVEGDGSIVRRNQVLDTGGTGAPRGMMTLYSVDVVDNTVSNVVAGPTSNTNAWGIYTDANLRGRVVGNAVRGVVGTAAAPARGMQHFGSGRVVIRGNDVIGAGSGLGVGCDSGNAHARDNMIIGFATGLSLCADDGNTISP